MTSSSSPPLFPFSSSPPTSSSSSSTSSSSPSPSSLSLVFQWHKFLSILRSPHSHSHPNSTRTNTQIHTQQQHEDIPPNDSSLSPPSSSSSSSTFISHFLSDPSIRLSFCRPLKCFDTLPSSTDVASRTPIHNDWTQIITDVSSLCHLSFSLSFHLIEEFLLENFHFHFSSKFSFSSSLSSTSLLPSMSLSKSSELIFSICEFYVFLRLCHLQSLSEVFRVSMDDGHFHQFLCAKLVTEMLNFPQSEMNKNNILEMNIIESFNEIQMEFTQMEKKKGREKDTNHSDLSTSAANYFSSMETLKRATIPQSQTLSKSSSSPSNFIYLSSDHLASECFHLVEILFYIYYSQSSSSSSSSPSPSPSPSKDVNRFPRLLSLMFNCHFGYKNINFCSLSPSPLSPIGFQFIEGTAKYFILCAMELLSVGKMTQLTQNELFDIVETLNGDKDRDPSPSFLSELQHSLSLVESSYSSLLFSSPSVIRRIDSEYFSPLWSENSSFIGPPIEFWRTLNLVWTVSLALDLEFNEEIQKIKITYFPPPSPSPSVPSHFPIDFSEEKRILSLRLQNSFGENFSSPIQKLIFITANQHGKDRGPSSSMQHSLPLIKNIVLEVLNGIFASSVYYAISTIHADSLSDFSELFVSLYSNDSDLGFHFWSEDEKYPSNRPQIIDNSMEIFPLDILSLLTLLGALCGNHQHFSPNPHGEDGKVSQMTKLCAAKCYYAMKKMKFITTENCPPNIIQSVQMGNGDGEDDDIQYNTTWSVSLLDHFVTPDGLQIPVGSFGRFLSPTVIQWVLPPNTFWSPWEMLFAKMKNNFNFIQNLRLHSHHHSQNENIFSQKEFKEILSIVKIVTKIISSDSKPKIFEEIIGQLEGKWEHEDQKEQFIEILSPSHSPFHSISHSPSSASAFPFPNSNFISFLEFLFSLFLFLSSDDFLSTNFSPTDLFSLCELFENISEIFLVFCHFEYFLFISQMEKSFGKRENPTNIYNFNSFGVAVRNVRKSVEIPLGKFLFSDFVVKIIWEMTQNNQINEEKQKSEETIFKKTKRKSLPNSIPSIIIGIIGDIIESVDLFSSFSFSSPSLTLEIMEIIHFILFETKGNEGIYHSLITFLNENPQSILSLAFPIQRETQRKHNKDNPHYGITSKGNSDGNEREILETTAIYSFYIVETLIKGETQRHSLLQILLFSPISPFFSSLIHFCTQPKSAEFTLLSLDLLAKISLFSLPNPFSFSSLLIPHVDSLRISICQILLSPSAPLSLRVSCCQFISFAIQKNENSQIIQKLFEENSAGNSKGKEPKDSIAFCLKKILSESLPPLLPSLSPPLFPLLIYIFHILFTVLESPNYFYFSQNFFSHCEKDKNFSFWEKIFQILKIKKTPLKTIGKIKEKYQKNIKKIFYPKESEGKGESKGKIQRELEFPFPNSLFEHFGLHILLIGWALQIMAVAMRNIQNGPCGLPPSFLSEMSHCHSDGTFLSVLKYILFDDENQREEKELEGEGEGDGEREDPMDLDLDLDMYHDDSHDISMNIDSPSPPSLSPIEMLYSLCEKLNFPFPMEINNGKGKGNGDGTQSEATGGTNINTMEWGKTLWETQNIWEMVQEIRNSPDGHRVNDQQNADNENDNDADSPLLSLSLSSLSSLFSSYISGIFSLNLKFYFSSCRLIALKSLKTFAFQTNEKIPKIIGDKYKDKNIFRMVNTLVIYIRNGSTELEQRTKRQPVDPLNENSAPPLLPVFGLFSPFLFSESLELLLFYLAKYLLFGDSKLFYSAILWTKRETQHGHPIQQAKETFKVVSIMAKQMAKTLKTMQTLQSAQGTKTSIDNEIGLSGSLFSSIVSPSIGNLISIVTLLTKSSHQLLSFYLIIKFQFVQNKIKNQRENQKENPNPTKQNPNGEEEERESDSLPPISSLTHILQRMKDSFSTNREISPSPSSFSFSSDLLEISSLLNSFGFLSEFLIEIHKKFLMGNPLKSTWKHSVQSLGKHFNDIKAVDSYETKGKGMGSESPHDVCDSDSRLRSSFSSMSLVVSSLLLHLSSISSSPQNQNDFLLILNFFLTLSQFDIGIQILLESNAISALMKHQGVKDIYMGKEKGKGKGTETARGTTSISQSVFCSLLKLISSLCDSLSPPHRFHLNLYSSFVFSFFEFLLSFQWILLQTLGNDGDNDLDEEFSMEKFDEIEWTLMVGKHAKRYFGHGNSQLPEGNFSAIEKFLVSLRQRVGMIFNKFTNISINPNEIERRIMRNKKQWEGERERDYHWMGKGKGMGKRLNAKDTEGKSKSKSLLLAREKSDSQQNSISLSLSTSSPKGEVKEREKRHLWAPLGHSSNSHSALTPSPYQMNYSNYTPSTPNSKGKGKPLSSLSPSPSPSPSPSSSSFSSFSSFPPSPLPSPLRRSESEESEGLRTPRLQSEKSFLFRQENISSNPLEIHTKNSKSQISFELGPNDTIFDAKRIENEAGEVDYENPQSGEEEGKGRDGWVDGQNEYDDDVDDGDDPGSLSSSSSFLSAIAQRVEFRLCSLLFHCIIIIRMETSEYHFSPMAMPITPMDKIIHKWKGNGNDSNYDYTYNYSHMDMSGQSEWGEFSPEDSSHLLLPHPFPFFSHEVKILDSSRMSNTMGKGRERERAKTREMTMSTTITRNNVKRRNGRGEDSSFGLSMDEDEDTDSLINYSDIVSVPEDTENYSHPHHPHPPPPHPLTPLKNKMNPTMEILESKSHVSVESPSSFVPSPLYGLIDFIFYHFRVLLRIQEMSARAMDTERENNQFEDEENIPLPMVRNHPYQQLKSMKSVANHSESLGNLGTMGGKGKDRTKSDVGGMDGEPKGNDRNISTLYGIQIDKLLDHLFPQIKTPNWQRKPNGNHKDKGNGNFKGGNDDVYANGNDSSLFYGSSSPSSFSSSFPPEFFSLQKVFCSLLENSLFVLFFHSEFHVKNLLKIRNKMKNQMEIIQFHLGNKGQTEGNPSIPFPLTFPSACSLSFSRVTRLLFSFRDRLHQVVSLCTKWHKMEIFIGEWEQRENHRSHSLRIRRIRSQFVQFIAEKISHLVERINKENA